VLAASVLGMFAASSGTVLMLPERAEGPSVPAPELAAATEPQALTPAEPASPAAAAAPVGPAVTGEQIAALALAPARERAAELIAQLERAEAEAAARAAAQQEDEPDSPSQREQWRELRDEIREACEDGRIRGPICRDA
jgi:hypothetical protein